MFIWLFFIVLTLRSSVLVSLFLTKAHKYRFFLLSILPRVSFMFFWHSVWKTPRQGQRGQKDRMSKILSPQSLRDSPPLKRWAVVALRAFLTTSWLRVFLDRRTECAEWQMFILLFFIMLALCFSVILSKKSPCVSHLCFILAFCLKNNQELAF
jgi:hypothetical protein